MDLQADLLIDLATRVAAPLIPLDASLRAASHLNPLFNVDGEKYMLGVQFLAAIPNRELRD